MSVAAAAEDRVAAAEPQVRRSLPFRWLLFVLTVVALSRYDATSLQFRGTDAVDIFNWVWRVKAFGAVSLIDVLLGIGVIVALVFPDPDRPRRLDLFLPLLAALVAISAISRAFHTGPFDTAQEGLFQLRNYLYTGAAYLAATRIHWTAARIQKLSLWLTVLAGITLLLTLWEAVTWPEYRVSKYGRFANVRDVTDYVFILFAQFWLFGVALRLPKKRQVLRAALAAVIAYSFYDAMTGIGKAALLIYPLALLYFVWQYRLYRRLWFWGIAGAVLVAVVALAAVIWFQAISIEAGSRLFVYKTFTATDSSVSTRAAEVVNTGKNLSRNFQWLTGLGLGTRWYEYQEQPPDLGAFPEQEQGVSYHYGIHIPFARLLFDLGVPAFLLLLALFYRRFTTSVRTARRSLDPLFAPFVHAAWLTVAYQVSINNLSVPKPNILVGALLAVLFQAAQRREHGDTRLVAGART